MKRDLFIKVSLIVVAVLLALNLIVSLVPTSSSSYAAKPIQYKLLIQVVDQVWRKQYWIGTAVKVGN